MPSQRSSLRSRLVGSPHNLMHADSAQGAEVRQGLAAGDGHGADSMISEAQRAVPAPKRRRISLTAD